MKRQRKSRRRQVISVSRLRSVGQCTMPDQLHCKLFYSHQFNSASATPCPGGILAYYNVSGNVPATPMVSPGSGPTFQAFSAVVGSQGFGGTAHPGFATAGNPAFYSALLAIYQNWYVESCSITVDVDTTSGNDEGDLYIAPVSVVNQNTTSGQNLSETRFVKTKRIGNYTFGGAGKANSLTSKMSTSKLMGLSSNQQTMVTSASYTGTGTANPGTVWIWQIGYVPRVASTLAGQLAIRTRVVYNVIWHNPVKKAN